jgi:hypothetical protein
LCFYFGERFVNKLFPLIAKTFVSNIPLPLDSLTNVAAENVRNSCQLHGNAGEKLAGMVDISTIPREEETCAEPSLFRVFVGNRAGDSGFSGSRHAVQPEDAYSIISIGPCSYLREYLDAGVWEAKRIVLIVVGVKGRLSSIL